MGPILHPSIKDGGVQKPVGTMRSVAQSTRWPRATNIELPRVGAWMTLAVGIAGGLPCLSLVFAASAAAASAATSDRCGVGAVLSFAKFCPSRIERCATFPAVARLRGLAMVSLAGLRLLSVPKTGDCQKQPEYRNA